MTRELKTLMDRATDRSYTFTPDPATLVAAGRRQVRKRRIIGSLSALAAVVGLTAGAAVAVDLQEPRSVAPATQDRKPTPTTVGSVRLCAASNGAVFGDDAWAWPEVVSISDQYGSASIRREPKPTRYSYTARYAFCTTQLKNAPTAPLGARGGVLVRKTPIDSTSSVTTVFGRAYGKDVKVLVRTGDGKSGEAVVKSEFYVYRHIDAGPWPGTGPTVVAQTLDARGNLTALGRW
ncbi:MAG TPA: hypothetical protein VFI00_23425 [Kribbella sp.]|nr:hypothetical protein [Kribbella sp.]